METHADFEKGGNLSLNTDIAACWFCGAGYYFQEGGFTRPIGAYDTDGCAFRDGKRDLAQCPEIAMAQARRWNKPV